MLVHILAAIY